VGGAAAVGIHDDLPAGEAAVGLGAADDEAAGGVHIELGILVQQLRGHGGLDDQLDHIPADLVQGSLGGMLGGDHHGVHPNGSAVFVILHGDLGFAVGAQIVHQALLADLGQAHGHLLGQGNGQGHQLRGLVAGIAEHHALVAGTVVQLLVGGLLGLQALVHAHGDVAGLLVDVGDHGAGVAVEAVLGPVIADVQHHLAGELGDIHIAVGGDLAHDVDQTRGGAGLAGHAAIGVLLQDGVQNGVADLVADLVGMPLGDGFGGKQSSCHDFSCSFVKKFVLSESPPTDPEHEKCTLRLSTDRAGKLLLICRRTNAGISLPRSAYVGFGTLPCRLPWFHRADPSTTLDKV